MKGLIQFAIKRQGPEEGPSWSKAEQPPLPSMDRRKSPRPDDPALDRAHNALRVVQARAKHKPNPGLDAVARKRAARILLGVRQ